MTKDELILLQNLPLDIKIAKSKLRIEEWISWYGYDKVYISFSGGKDSTVLMHLVRQVNPSIPAVFVDTGLEYPEVKDFVKKQENVITLRPDMSFKQVIETYGYPMVSKEQANYLDDIRTGTDYMRTRRLEGDSKGRFKLSKKWHYLMEAPFKVSHRCCNIMKKKPIKKYEKETGKVPFIGTMASESQLRQQSYLKNGCNAFESKRPISTPIGFWTEQDVLAYIKLYNLEIASVYGEIVTENGKLKTTKCDRTGCVFCGFGVHLEKEPNRYQRLEQTHPQLHRYCMDKLGFKGVCQYMNIPYKNKEEWEERADYHIIKSNDYNELIDKIFEAYPYLDKNDKEDCEIVAYLLSQLNDFKGIFVVYGDDDNPLGECVIKKISDV